MKRLKYISWVCFAAMLLIGCEDEYVYNTRTVNAIEILGTNEDGGLLFSKGESGEVKIKMLPVDATDKSAYSFSFESSNEEVFTVDSVGVINTVSPGEAVLSVRSVNNANVSLSCSVVVQPNWIRTIELPQGYKNYNLLVGNTLDLGSIVTLKPEKVDDPTLNYTSSNSDIASVNPNGVVTGISVGDTEIIIQAADGGGAETSASIHVVAGLWGDFPRALWKVTASHAYVPDDKGSGAPEAILDGNPDTFLSIRKPGKGAETPSGATIFFTIDQEQAFPFNYFRWHHRGDNTSANLRATEVELYGSNDGVDFEAIQKGIALDPNADASVGEKIVLEKKTSYRYLRFVIVGYPTTNGSAVQISEVYIGNE